MPQYCATHRKGDFYKRGRGLLGAVIVIVLIVIVLGALGIDVRRVVESDQVQKNLGFLWGVVTDGWHAYVSPVIAFVRERIASFSSS